jgi:hypothetical protein
MDISTLDITTESMWINLGTLHNIELNNNYSCILHNRTVLQLGYTLFYADCRVLVLRYHDHGSISVIAPGTGKVGSWPYLKMPGPTTGLTLDDYNYNKYKLIFNLLWLFLIIFGLQLALLRKKSCCRHYSTYIVCTN